MFISVIIPMYNARATIIKTLEALNKQSLKEKFEVILIDDGSPDDTLKLLDEYNSLDNLKILKQNNLGPAKARNLGLKEARGDIILFTDSDCIPEYDWFKITIDEFKKQDKPLILSGSIVNGLDGYFANAFHACWAHSFSPRLVRENRAFAICANMAVSRQIFNDTGSFDERMQKSEDTDFCIRARNKGFEIIYLPQSKVTHLPRMNTFKDFREHRYQHGLWTAIFSLRYRQSLKRNRFFYPNILLMLLLLPILYLGSLAATFLANAKYSLKDAFLYFPLIFLGRMLWCAGVIEGVRRYKKGSW